MKNKVLISVYIPSICEQYELFIPINESIKKVVDLIVKSVIELSDGALVENNNYALIDPENSIIYDMSFIVRNTNIKNYKKLILI